MDFLGGIAVGINQVLIGHPFDTTKVLIQNKISWKNLKLKDYYRGWRYPIMSSVLCNTFIFPIQERTYKYTNNNWTSGFLGGLFQGPIVYLFDLGKIKKQTHKPNFTFKNNYKKQR